MLKELSEDLSSIKKIQSESKGTIIEIRNNLTVTRRVGERDNGGKKRKGQVKEHIYKEPRDKDNGVIEFGRVGVGGTRVSNGGKLGQL